MATTACTLGAERWLDEILVLGSVLNTMGADFVELFTLPAGIGDVAIMEIEASVTSNATLVTALEQLGVLAHVLSSDETAVVDIIGTERPYKISATALAIHWSPDPLVLWRQAERLTFRGPELDSNAAPTGDLGIRVKCVRVRPQEGAAAPLRLVR